MKNSFFSKFGPKEPKFFDYLQKLAAINVSAVTLLDKCVQSTTHEGREAYYKQVKEEERKGDRLSRKFFDELGDSFITPFDREDIHALVTSIDDVLDCTNRTASRITTYNPQTTNTSQASLMVIIIKSIKLIEEAMKLLPDYKNTEDKLTEICQELHDLETEADEIYSDAIMNLFEEEKNAIELIKMKEILAELESTTDAAYHVSKVLKTIIVKYT